MNQQTLEEITTIACQLYFERTITIQEAVQIAFQQWMGDLD